jgi:prophage maintenance system killer protein
MRMSGSTSRMTSIAWTRALSSIDTVEGSIDTVEDPVEAAALVAFRVARAQAFGEANKRTALALAKWTLDRNGLDGHQLFPAEDREVADLLIEAAAGRDVEAALFALLRARANQRSTS